MPALCLKTGSTHYSICAYSSLGKPNRAYCYLTFAVAKVQTCDYCVS